MTSLSFDLMLRLLAIAALMDWLLTRTLTRLAIFIPKTPAMITGYEVLAFVGQVGSSLAGLLVLAGVGWIIGQEVRRQRPPGLPAILAARLGLSLLFLVIAPAAWLSAVAHLLTLAAIFWLVGAFLARDGRSGGFAPLHVALLLPALVLSLGEVFHLIPVLYRLLGWSGPPSFTLPIFNLGELLFIVAPILFWWNWGRGASRRAWIGGLIPAALFAALYVASPAMTATIVIWSTGMTLYLPWPLYVLSFWLAGTTILACVQRQDRVGWGLVLFAAGGYAPQFSVQIFFSLMALWVMVSSWSADSLPDMLTNADKEHFWRRKRDGCKMAEPTGQML
ncbi:MAG: hypothetical protein KF893_23290 [Caldilineaceae bacterium]|nr:hypothetical protein [Caldilineaceae bacterium]